MAEFDESKHPRDEDGKFTNGNKTYYRQNASYGEIVAADKKAEAEKFKDFALKDQDSLAVYEQITQGDGYSVEELEKLPVFQRIQEEAEKSMYEQAKRLGMPDEYAGFTDRIKTPEREKARAKREHQKKLWRGRKAFYLRWRAGKRPKSLFFQYKRDYRQ